MKSLSREGSTWGKLPPAITWRKQTWRRGSIAAWSSM